MDEAFIIFQRRKQLNETDTSQEGAAMNVITRVRFEKHKAEAQDYSLRARSKLVEFWAELSLLRPDLGKLANISREIADSVSKAELAYVQLLRINPRSVTVLRGFAQFLLEVTNNPSRAERLVEEADSIEEEMSRNHQAQSSTVDFLSREADLDVGSESVGVLTISDRPDKLGHILDANSQALKIYGYTRRELIGKSMNILLPEPLSKYHDIFLQRYRETGKTIMLGTTRVAFAVHRAGHIFPVVQGIKSMDEGFGGLVQLLPTQFKFVMFMSNSFTVTGCCQESLSMLGVTPEDVKSGSVKLSRWVQGIEEMVHVLNLRSAMHRDDVSTSSSEEEEQHLTCEDGRDPVAGCVLEVKNVPPAYHADKGRRQSITAASRRRVGGKISIWGQFQLTKVPNAKCMNAHTFVPGSLSGSSPQNQTSDAGSSALPRSHSRSFMRHLDTQDYLVILKWMPHKEDAVSCCTQ